MRSTRFATLFSVLCIATLLFSGCYSSQVTTNRQPTQRTIEEPFASGFFYGLITPGAKFYAGKCNHGVAQVNTKVSFLNLVASNLTFGLYTPMHVTVRCAEDPNEQSASVFQQKTPRIAPPSTETFSASE